MQRLTSTSRNKKKALVSPSSRDSISGWLDVLTSMLSLPESQRVMVRDELEDHLRSRVDDLLITGTPEHEAIRIAVAELGETAELAKLISHAHRRANPRRRIVNIALMTIAVAGLSIGGISWNNAGGGGVAVLGEQSGTLVDVSGIASDSQDTHHFSAESKPVLNVLKEIARAFGRDFEMDREMATGHLAEFVFSQTSSLDGEFTFEQSMELFQDRFSEEMYGYKLTCTDTTVRVQSFEEYQRSLIETRVIPSPSWLMGHELIDFAGSLTNLIEVKHDLSRSSIEVVGGTIVVAAPPSIQDELKMLVAELNVVVQKQMEIKAREEQAAEEERNRRRDINRSKVVQEVKAECTEVDHRLEKNKELLEEILGGIEVLHQRVEQQTANPHPDSPSLETLNDFLRTRNSQVERLRHQISEDETRRAYLTKKRFDAEYAHLFDGTE